MEDYHLKGADASPLIFLTDLLAPIYCLLSLAAIASRYVPTLAIFASHGKTWKRSSHWCWISKRCFVHFYCTGVTSLVFLAGWYNPQPPSLPLFLLFCHLLRRIYECQYVHQSRPTSKMHLAGYGLGMGHYLILPLVFVGRPAGDVSSLSLLMGAANLWMQYEQYQHHLILAQARTVNGPSYSLPPHRRWFRFVLCPHYLAEILIYFTWALLLKQQQQQQQGTAIVSDMSRPATSIWEDLLKYAAIYRHWFLFLWTVTNLTISSRNNYVWYQSRYPNLSQSALIPFIL
jgi:hypothetical protein